MKNLTHVAVLQCISFGKHNRTDFVTLQTIIHNTGVVMDIWEPESKLVRLYGDPATIIVATDVFNECRDGKWGTNVKAIAERFTITGPYELLAPKTSEPGQ